MGVQPSTAIVRKFNGLNILNILRLQAELQDLESKLSDIRAEDADAQGPDANDLDRPRYVKDFQLMRSWKQQSGDSEQYDTILEIGQTLQEYNTALQQMLDLRKAEAPTAQEVGFLQTWLKRPTQGGDFLNDVEIKIWAEENVADLISLSHHRLHQDPFSKFLAGKLLNAYPWVVGRRADAISGLLPDGGIKEYKDERMLALSKAMSSALSALLPTVTILVLYFVHRMLVRIGLMIIFTVLFSLALSAFTEARKVDVFSATAAFAAVEVVFIGSTSTNSTST
ncbi:hypothetical protein LTS15_010993 [Exophiala xenobiotica]|nr:hypothetical protein LTS15_010993 [Exophiala xenobiotica]